MKAVVQRVLEACLKVDGKIISEIGQGVVIFLGVGQGDTENDLEKMTGIPEWLSGKQNRGG